MNEDKLESGKTRSLKRVVGSKILINKVNPVTNSLIIATPDTVLQKNLTGIVKSIGRDVVNKSLKENSMVVVDATSAIKIQDYQVQSYVAASSQDDYLIKEDNIIIIKVGKVWRPYGKRVLLERINDEVKVGNIVVPSCYQSSDQSQFGIVAQHGILDGEIVKGDYEVGDIVRIAAWSEKIKEIEIDRHYFLSVPINLLIYKCNHQVMQENFIQP